MWGRIVRFFDRREPATSLAVFRMALGLASLHTFETVLRHGLVPMIWVNQASGGYRNVAGNGLVNLLGGPTVPVMTSLTWLGVVLSVLLVLGVGGRLTALLLLQVALATTDINSHTGGAYDEVLTNLLFLAVLAPIGRTLSVDCRLRTGKWRDDTPVPGWVRFVILFQMVLIYGTTGWQKVSHHWVPGGDFSALYYILQQPTWQRFDHRWIAPFYPVTQLATAITWFWEVMAPLWLLAWWYAETPERPGCLRHWSNRLYVREVFVAVGLAMHFWLQVLMDVGPFAFVSIAMYPALYAPEVWDRWFARIASRTKTASPAARSS